MATIDAGQLASLDPVLTQATSAPSPAEEKAALTARAAGSRARLTDSEGVEPTTRQRTQSEILDLELHRFRSMDPFSVRYIPFQQLREMTTDHMFGFGWHMTMAPLVRADWHVECPSAKIAAAVDEAFRPIATGTYLAYSNDLWYGHQPLCKRFRLGRLGSTYSDPNAADPMADMPVWSSSADALLWQEPLALNPSHCLPMWDEDGGMIGFKFSQLPIPNYDLLSAASSYGYENIPGKVIDSDYAMWSINESEMQFGSIYGSPRTKRAYRFWWSYWYRWALADRAFENTVDPVKLVYFPTDTDEFLDPDDTDGQIKRMRERALRVGESARSGATVALPGDFVEGPDGHPTSARKWALSYLEGQQHFAELDATFSHLEILKLRAWMTPEQAFLEGKGGTSSRLVATQLGEVYQESQQLLIDRYDQQTSEDMFRQFIEVNFPDQAGIPCRKVSKGLGAIDAQILQQVLTLVGQVRGNFLPIDMRKLLSEMGLPLLTKKQWEQEMKDISTLAAISGAQVPGGSAPTGPSPTAPTPRGTQGYNAGVERTPAGETRYFQPGERIVLAESDSFMNSLPDTPHYREAGVRSAIVRLRRLLVDRYGEQYASLAEYLESQPALFLAVEYQAPLQTAAPQQGLSQQDAQRVSTRLIEAWAAVHAAGVAGSPIEAMADAASVPAKMAVLLGKIAFVGGKGTLKGARLDAEDFGSGVLKPWVTSRVGTSLNSIDDTVRSEAQDWLEGQLQQNADPAAVAAAAREHFVDMPQTHADRVARTETAMAYNHGSLTALHLAGVAQVQAHDASDGTDHLTDAECQQRNGKIYSVEDAMNVHDHPNGSLFWVPLTTEKLSITRVDALPHELNGHGESVAYDERTETLYLLSDVDEEQERMLLLMLGDQIAYR